jgi:hypothetical protein
MVTAGWAETASEAWISLTIYWYGLIPHIVGSYNFGRAIVPYVIGLIVVIEVNLSSIPREVPENKKVMDVIVWS